jgi:hypothetical protein
MPRPEAYRLAPVESELTQRHRHSARAARLMDLLGLSEDELCQTLDVDPLTLLSGQLQHSAELPILLTLLEEAAEHVTPALLKAWTRSGPPGQRPVDALTTRDFTAFEDAVADLIEHGFVLRGGR